MHITIHAKNIIHIEAKTNQSLAKAIWLSGKLEPPPLCSGLGRCAQCKVIFISNAPRPKESELNLLSTVELSQGIRLACKHDITELEQSNNCIEIALTNCNKTHKYTNINTHNYTSARLAVDLGTTSLHWQAIAHDKGFGEIIASGQQINPQMGAGSDIVSRLAFVMQEQNLAKKAGHASEQAPALLSKLVQDALKDIISKLPPITEICLAANTAMTAIFLQKPIQSLAVAPYALPFSGHSIEHIKNLPPIYIPTQLAPFVGGDISAGYAALMQQENISFPFLFVDLGTNGEFILALDEQNAHITSVPLGPALEGIGLSLGHMAQTGARGIVNAVHLSPKGLEPTTLDGGMPQRICGTGYLSLLHCLLQSGIVQEDGHFCTKESIKNPLGLRLYNFIDKQGEEPILKLWPHLCVDKSMYISSTDIEEILKVKAAFSLATQGLLMASGVKVSDLTAIYLGGAMGSYVQGEDLEALGFIPYGMSSRLVRVGNCSLSGATVLLENIKTRQWLHDWGKKTTHVQLATQHDFIKAYMQHMRFTFTG